MPSESYSWSVGETSGITEVRGEQARDTILTHEGGAMAFVGDWRPVTDGDLEALQHGVLRCGEGAELHRHLKALGFCDPVGNWSKSGFGQHVVYLAPHHGRELPKVLRDPVAVGLQRLDVLTRRAYGIGHLRRVPPPRASERLDLFAKRLHEQAILPGLNAIKFACTLQGSLQC